MLYIPGFKACFEIWKVSSVSFSRKSDQIPPVFTWHPLIYVLVPLSNPMDGYINLCGIAATSCRSVGHSSHAQDRSETDSNRGAVGPQSFRILALLLGAAPALRDLFFWVILCMAAGLFKLIARLLLEVLLWTQLSSWGWAVAPLEKSSKWPRRARDNSLPWKSWGKIRDLAEKIILLHEKIIYLHRPRPTYLYCWKNASKYSKLQLMPTLQQLLPASHGEQSPQPNGPPTPNNFLFYFCKEILFDGEPVKPSTSSHYFGDVSLWYIYIHICIWLFFWKNNRRAEWPSPKMFRGNSLHEEPPSKKSHHPRIIGRNLMRYALTERNLLSYIRHPFIVPF